MKIAAVSGIISVLIIWAYNVASTINLNFVSHTHFEGIRWYQNESHV